VTAPATGRITDRIGARRATVILLLLSGTGIGVMALSTNWVVLALSAVISGIPQGWGNPTTNALIAERVPARARGTITGIKQSGVQFGIFLSGFTLPGLALALGWRGALWGYAIAFSIGAVAVALTIGPAPAAPSASVPVGGHGAPAPGDQRAGRAPLPRFIWMISGYALLYGTVGGAVGRFFPLWANEVVGLSTVVAGALVALSGLLGIATRIAAGRLAQERIDPSRLLAILGVIGAGYCLVLLLTTTIGAWVLWPATVMNSIGIAAWNAVAMLAVIMTVPRESSGRASGVVMLGFLGGLTIGSPLAGAVVDRWDTYQPVWAVALVLGLCASALISSAVGQNGRGDPVGPRGRTAPRDAPR
jgi:MFS family permease